MKKLENLQGMMSENI